MARTGDRRAARGPARIVGLVALAATVAAACQPTGPVAPDAPPPPPPSTDAPAGTWRSGAERAAGTGFQALYGTAASAEVRRAWAHEVVRGTGWSALLQQQARTSSGSRRLLARLATTYSLPVASATLDADAGDLVAGRRTHDQIVAAWLAAPTVRTAAGSDAAWVDALHRAVLGAEATSAVRSALVARLSAGTAHATVALELWSSATFRRAVVGRLHQVVGAPSPTTAAVEAAATDADRAAGDLRPTWATAATSALVASRSIPPSLRLGIPGDSVAFELGYYRGAAPIGPVGADNGGNRIGCGVMAARNWMRQRADGTWILPSDGNCSRVLAGELAAAAKSDVMLWITGSWEWEALRSPGGTIVPARSTKMADLLAVEMVVRIDSWREVGVDRVVLSDWPCPGEASRAELRDPAYRRWHRAVLDRVARARPGVVSVTVAPAQVCAPDGRPTATADRLREGEHHWVGSDGVKWAWRVWYASALADLRTS